MLKRLRVTVDGNSYDVIVETSDEINSPAMAAPVAPVAAPAPSVAPAPAEPTPVPAPTPAPAPKPVASALAGPAGAGDVPSPLAGRVTAVMVSVGQEVKEGDHLVTLEAMKMNTFVFAPKNGKVATVLVEVGSVVEENQVLVRIG